MLLVPLVFACESKRYSKEYYENGALKRELITTKAKIQCLTYYENGKLESEGELLADGLRVGNWRYYHNDGKLKAAGEYNDGLKEGSWRYSIGDSSYSINWSAYVNRPVRVNVPENWVLKEQLAPNIPLAGFSDSINSVANFNIVILNKEGKSLDSVISETIRAGRESLAYDITVLSTKEIKINETKGKVVRMRILAENKRLMVMQYFLDRSDLIYQISFFVNADKEAVYETLMKEIAFSFTPV